MKRLTLLAGFLIGNAAIACGDNAPTVTVAIDNATFTSGSTVTLTVAVTDFELVAPGGSHALRVAGEAHQETGSAADEYIVNEGHFHVYLDSTTVNPLLQAHLTTVQLPVVATPGAHRLIVRLNDNRHKFLVPEVTADVDVTVQ